MTPEEMHRAGSAIATRIDQLHTNAAAIAREAGVHPTTVRALVHGRRWPHQDTRDRISRALNWPAEHIVRVAMDGTSIEDVSVEELARVLYERLRNAHCA